MKIDQSNYTYQPNTSRPRRNAAAQARDGEVYGREQVARPKSVEADSRQKTARLEHGTDKTDGRRSQSPAPAGAIEYYHQHSAATQAAQAEFVPPNETQNRVEAGQVERVNNRLVKTAVAAYHTHQNLEQRDQVERVLGIDTYA